MLDIFGNGHHNYFEYQSNHCYMPIFGQFYYK